MYWLNIEIKIIAIIFGLIIGSFLNSLIYRLPRKKTLLDRSRCTNCNKKIKWYDNLPIISFFILKGHCRNCKKKISWQYPIIEALTGILFLLVFLIYQNFLSVIYLLFLISLFILIAVIDLKYYIILDKTIIIGVLAAFVYIFLFPQGCFKEISCSLLSSIKSITIFAGIFFLVFIISKGKWIGFGDVKLMALVGLIFGLKNSIDIFYLTFLIGLIVAIILLALKKAKLKTEIPLGTILSSAVIMFLLTKFSFVDWLIKISDGLILKIFK